MSHLMPPTSCTDHVQIRNGQGYLLSDSLGNDGLYKFDCTPQPSSPQALSIVNTSSNL
ncbi:hypothetical protein A2U01_0048460 [Trifolium medium]|uniref:Uncharacterized protein n=1 Tax=Trifolium medium TaxID=97028 RepID=A0A392QTR7_9FABA|nr:hypothetical protein [Trifolium medium]